jgi:hypothetical protein
LDFVDQTLIRLAAANTRAAVFDQRALEHLVAAGYDATGLGVTGPYQPVFEDFRLGLSLMASPRVDGTWQRTGNSEVTEVRAMLNGWGGDPIRVDGLWRGSIIARAALAESRINKVEGNWADLNLETLDDEIAADLGALPSQPQLEQERRGRLLARLRNGLAHPAVVTDATISDWLDDHGAESVGGLLAQSQGQLATAGMTVTYDPPPAGQPLPRPLPVTVALLIRNVGISVAELLSLSHRIREQLAWGGAERPNSPAGRRQAILIGWVLPQSLLADTDWPGADSDARRDAASAWLGPEGIALIPVT